ncbi:unnamed protein product [Thlaspi arvense]|uniref:Uncharacterized protein n=1 Tax=Thlaspi arvense TaxID=13288 RepID=A0AAU9S127_THLAR|nr:unnamed protein product [Thlaspi arvense]
MAPPKSSEDGETKDGSSSDSQVTEPMETCSSVASSLLGKRKAETTNAEDPEESEGDGEESEGEGEDSDLVWDKDSFDGQVYNPSDYPVYSDEELGEQCHNYYRAVIETKGFFEPTGNFPRYHWDGIVPVPESPPPMLLIYLGSSLFTTFVQNKNVKFDHFLRANFNPGGRTKYYITFAARESPDAPLVEYQAKAIREAGETYPILCRPASPPKKGTFLPRNPCHILWFCLWACYALVVFEGGGRGQSEDVAKAVEEVN